MSQKRKIKNTFVLPDFQLKLSMYYVIIGGLILNAIAFFVSSTNEHVLELMNSNQRIDFHTQVQINELTMACFHATLFGFVFFIAFSFFFAVVMSHRIAGPQLAIKQYIEALKRGDYNCDRKLRPTDELVEVMDALKELAPILRERDQMSKDRGNPAPGDG
jgi:H+/Cl- antiporter ClcA